MTSDQYTDLTAINEGYCNFVADYAADNQIKGEKIKEDILSILYLREYIYTINAYFAQADADDENFCTATQIQTVLDSANEIMNTIFTIDFTISDYTYTNNYWDDIDIWYFNIGQ